MRGWIGAVGVLLGGALLTTQDEPRPAPAGGGSGTLHGWAQLDDARACARLVYYVEDPPGTYERCAGQIAIEYPRIAWSDTLAEAVQPLLDGSADLPEVQRWRLGRDAWTTLDARLPLAIGGTPVPAGFWYLVLEAQRGPPGRWNLCLLDPADVSARGLDGWHVSKRDLPVRLRAPLALESLDPEAKMLQIVLRVTDPADPRQAELRIDFGGHRLAAPVHVEAAP